MSELRARSGRPIDAIDLEALARGELGVDDARIAPATLHAQADLAERHGYRPLAENLRRAAELADIPDDELLAMYELLRPRRATAAELTTLADRLQPRAPRTAHLVRTARDAYVRRGLVRPGP